MVGYSIPASFMQEYSVITAAENILFAKPSYKWRKRLK